MPCLAAFRSDIFGGMKSYEFYPQVVVRVPRLPMAMIDASVQEMLDNPVFRDALYLASDVLYSQLQKTGFSEKEASRKIRETLAKYQRRICTRPTPYGGFASTAITNWSNASDTLRVDIESFQTVVLERQEPSVAVPLLRLNPSLYKYGEHYRLYERRVEAGGGIVLTEINGAAVPKDLTEFNRSVPGDVFLEHLRTYGLTTLEGEQYTGELLHNGVLIDGAPSSSHRVVPFSGHQLSGSGSQFYCHTRHDVAGGVDNQVQKDIRDALHCLAHLSLPQNNQELEEFRKRFLDRFDRQQVPLLTALDPEAGVGYSVNRPAESRCERLPSWSQIHELMLRKWTAHKGADLPVIRLEEDDLEHLRTSPVHCHAPGMAVMFSMLEHGIQLHSAGGVSGLNLVGRLTAFDHQLHSHACEIAAIEQERNPDMIFAEIVFDTGDRTDKLNFRSGFRKYVIPLLTPVDTSDENIILLNDLYLSLAHGKLILRSKRLNKRVIPRLSSAYNYKRETFGVFRFLCDMQDEGVQSNLHFSMERLFPGLPFYPAVFYKNTLLQPASWHLEGRLFRYMLEEPKSAFERFSLLAAELQLPPVFVYEEHDQRLMIRRDAPGDIAMLLQTIKQKKAVVLREYFQSDFVTDADGHTYAHELLAFLVNKETIYSNAPIGPVQLRSSEGFFSPLTDWIYIKVYLHPQGMNELLLEHIDPFMRACIRRRLASQWFFVRYYDSDHHLRVRLRSRKGRRSELFGELQDFLSKLGMLPNIRSISIDTYQREVERYATIGIGRAEQLFWLSSELAVASLSEKDDSFMDESFSDYEIQCAVQHLTQALKVSGLAHGEADAFVESYFRSLETTLKITKKQRLNFDRDFRRLRKTLTFPDTNRRSKRYWTLLTSCLSSLPVPDQIQVLSDLVHMHLNRLFSADGSRKEAITYYYLLKLRLYPVSDP